MPKTRIYFGPLPLPLPLLLPLLLLLSLARPANAQDCKAAFAPVQEGMTREITNYDKKDKIQSVATTRIDKLTSIDGGLEVKASVETTDDKRKEIHKGELTYQCKNGILYMDMRSFLSPETTTAFKGDGDVIVEGLPMELPNDLKVGQTLPDASVTMTIGILKMKLFITERKVVAQENVTTPAGPFNAFKITYTLEMNFAFSQTYQVTEWLAAGVGPVKTETYKKDKMVGRSELTKLIKP